MSCSTVFIYQQVDHDVWCDDSTLRTGGCVRIDDFDRPLLDRLPLVVAQVNE